MEPTRGVVARVEVVPLVGFVPTEVDVSDLHDFGEVTDEVEHERRCHQCGVSGLVESSLCPVCGAKLPEPGE